MTHADNIHRAGNPFGRARLCCLFWLMQNQSGDSNAPDCCTARRNSRGLQDELIAQRSLAGVVARALSRARLDSQAGCARARWPPVEPRGAWAADGRARTRAATLERHEPSERHYEPGGARAAPAQGRVGPRPQLPAVPPVQGDLHTHQPAPPLPHLRPHLLRSMHGQHRGHGGRAHGTHCRRKHPRRPPTCPHHRPCPTPWSRRPPTIARPPPCALPPRSPRPSCAPETARPCERPCERAPVSPPRSPCPPPALSPPMLGSP